MSYIKGKPLSPEEKKLLISVKQYFDRNRNEFGAIDSSSQMAADALGISLATVNRVIASYNKDPKSINALPQVRGRPSYAINVSLIDAVRTYIRRANIEGHRITLETIRSFIEEKSKGESFHISTLARTLDRWGFKFGKGIRTQRVKEKDHVIVARQRYLRRMRQNRLFNSENTIRKEVYLDESYINKNHSNDLVWYFRSDGPWIQKPLGKGERLIIMNAITTDGWVKNAKVVFKSTRKTGDYHGQMNGEIFMKWFADKLLASIPDNSIIVMDNASYHNILADHSAPTPTCAKKHIQTWLEANKIPCRDDCLKVELVEILKKIVPEPTYAIDEFAQKHGHEVVRTPPYHPELQPIEICWGILKNEVARNCNSTQDNLKLQLEKAFERITAKTCQKIIKQVRTKEDMFWEEDAQMEHNQ